MTSPADRPTLASFWHDLPREGKLLLSVVVFEFIGTGLVLPFHVVYLHEVRGFALSDVGLLLGLSPLVGFLVVGPGGSAIDRLGARRLLMAAISLQVVSNVLLAYSSAEWMAAGALMLSGVSFGVTWPGFQTLIAAVVPAELRQRYFGVNFTLLNLGIGIGGIVGGAFVDVDRLVTFQVIYLGDAVSYLPALFLMLVPLRHVAGRPDHGDDAPPAKVSYLEVARRPAVAALMLLSFVSSYVGYSQLNAGMPAFARAVGEVSTQGLGLAFAANTVVIVLLQLVVLQRIEGRRRTRIIAVMSVVWACSWLLLGATGLVSGTWGATLLVASCAAVFAFGETLLQPTIPALTNELAPDHLRGRYNALTSGAFQLAAIIAPPIAGVLVGHGLGSVYIGSLVAGCLLCGVLAIARLEPQLSPEVNGVRPSPPETPPAPTPKTLPASVD
ncbi:MULTISPECIES: MFS transporter [unclassified Nocardioides]|uniref:MFS transporter n=1 Tax=unclassified Nocardioides TaxID=2615069 RepID=UPI0009EFA2E0|nr:MULTISPECIES: MFS transporter [unclassified Nocardioides]GAW50755.1 major facilitator transporter [Nocardioides sp. PD653-B2]GAW55494.1 major facilitator transporter [Nocardioides sp. PD653]